MNDNKKDLRWHEDGGMIATLIIAVVIIGIIVSQSFAVGGSLMSFSSVINHNSLYIFILIYFGLICFPIGKRYFNYLNVFLVFIYLISCITSFLTLLQSFGLNTMIDFFINTVLFVYLFHTMFRGTRIWKDLNLGSSPFNEISNDGFFLTVVVLLIVSLIVNLISTVVVSGLFVSILDTLYLLLLNRYIYLYRDYLDYNRLDSDNDGNFDEIKNHINEVSDIIDAKIESVDIEETLNDVSNKIKDVSDDILSKTSEVSKSVRKKKDSVNKNTNKTSTKDKDSKSSPKKRSTKKSGDDK